MLSFSTLLLFMGYYEATVAQQAEQLICNQRVGGSIPFGGSRERFPSGQREQTVNLPAQPTEVRTLPPPPYSLSLIGRLRRPMSDAREQRAGVAQWLERQPSKLRVAGSNPVSRSIFYERMPQDSPMASTGWR